MGAVRTLLGLPLTSDGGQVYWNSTIGTPAGKWGQHPNAKAKTRRHHVGSQRERRRSATSKGEAASEPVELGSCRTANLADSPSSSHVNALLTTTRDQKQRTSCEAQTCCFLAQRCGMLTRFAVGNQPSD